MNQEYYNTENRKGKHLCLWERKEIEKALRSGASLRGIAKALGRPASTVFREIKRGAVLQRKAKSYISSKPDDPGYIENAVYFADTGQAAAARNMGNRTGAYKLFQSPELIRYIENAILEKRYSPDSIIGGLKRNGHHFETMVCTKTVYNYIERGQMAVKNLDLILKPRLKVKHRHSRANKRKLGTSIDLRPQSVNERQEFGHFEGDSIVGKDGKSSALTLTERLTTNGFILKVSDKGASSAVEAFKELHAALGPNVIKSITFDNGSEFAACHELEKLGIKVYYAHPYSAWERGINENYNGIIRRYIPKGKALNVFSQADLNRICNIINNLPRKRLRYLSAEQMFNLELEKLFSRHAG
jgi:IS30 family transposase